MANRARAGRPKWARGKIAKAGKLQVPTGASRPRWGDLQVPGVKASCVVSAGQGRVELAKVGKLQVPKTRLVSVCLGRVFARV